MTSQKMGNSFIWLLVSETTSGTKTIEGHWILVPLLGDNGTPPNLQATCVISIKGRLCMVFSSASSKTEHRTIQLRTDWIQRTQRIKITSSSRIEKEDDGILSSCYHFLIPIVCCSRVLCDSGLLLFCLFAIIV